MFGARSLTWTPTRRCGRGSPAALGVSSPRLWEGGGFIAPVFQSSKVRLPRDRPGQSYPDVQRQSRGRIQLGGVSCGSPARPGVLWVRAEGPFTEVRTGGRRSEGAGQGE